MKEMRRRRSEYIAIDPRWMGLERRK